jgi:hypothetical protein
MWHARMWLHIVDKSSVLIRHLCSGTHDLMYLHCALTAAVSYPGIQWLAIRCLLALANSLPLLKQDLP